MQYHAKLLYGDQYHYWWDASKERIIKDLLIPFVNGQVVLIHTEDGNYILNMKSVTLLRVYKTKHKLEGEFGIAPDEMVQPEFEQFDCTEELLNQVKQAQANPDSASLLQMALATKRKQVFVIMKFGDKRLDSAYQGVFKPVIEEFGFKVLRIDEVQNSGRITDQVLESIAVSKYVLADLSGERPNCYYEAGFAHALGKELILTIRREDAIHFDLAGYRFIQWETEAELRAALKQRFNALRRAPK